MAGALTDYSGKGLAIFHLGKLVELVIGTTLVAAFYLGGVSNPLSFLVKTIALLFVAALIHALNPRLRIDQTVGLWWRFGAILVLLQHLVTILLKR